MCRLADSWLIEYLGYRGPHAARDFARFDTATRPLLPLRVPSRDAKGAGPNPRAWAARCHRRKGS
jgi:hypothetical protein